MAEQKSDSLTYPEGDSHSFGHFGGAVALSNRKCMSPIYCDEGGIMPPQNKEGSAVVMLQAA